jgi:hypothetical protein
VADVTPSPAEEARHLHASLFHKPLDAVVIARYQAALEVGYALACPGEVNLSGQVVSTVVARRLDAEAVEFALRRRGLGRELTRRMQILCYLVEVRPDYLSEFVNLESLHDAHTQASFAPHGTARVSERTTAMGKAKLGEESHPQSVEAGTVRPTAESTPHVVVAQAVSPATSGSAAAAWAALLCATLRSGWKLLKGEYLVRRHGLV